MTLANGTLARVTRLIERGHDVAGPIADLMAARDIDNGLDGGARWQGYYDVALAVLAARELADSVDGGAL